MDKGMNPLELRGLLEMMRDHKFSQEKREIDVPVEWMFSVPVKPKPEYDA